MDAQAGTGIVVVGEGAQSDPEAVGSFFDGGFGEAGELEEATSNSGVASGVEGGRGLRIVGSGGGIWVERGGGANFDFEVVEGAFRFDDAVPAEGRAGFGESGGLASGFAAVGTGFQGGHGVAVENEAQNDIENYRGQREGCSYFASRAF